MLVPHVQSFAGTLSVQVCKLKRLRYLIYIDRYSTIALVCETGLAFEDMWIERCGDVRRSRMAT